MAGKWTPCSWRSLAMHSVDWCINPANVWYQKSRNTRWLGTFQNRIMSKLSKTNIYIYTYIYRDHMEGPPPKKNGVFVHFFFSKVFFFLRFQVYYPWPIHVWKKFTDPWEFGRGYAPFESPAFEMGPAPIHWWTTRWGEGECKTGEGNFFLNWYLE